MNDLGQCAQLWIKTLRRRTTRPVVALVLAGEWVVVAYWLTWWRGGGFAFVNGSSVYSAFVEQWVKTTFPGSAVVHSNALPTILSVYSVTLTFEEPLLVWAGAVLWLLPLLAWTMRRGTESPRSVHSALPDIQQLASPEEELPSLRRVLSAAVLGAVSSWVAVAAVMAYLHSWPVPFDQRAVLFAHIYWTWLLVALIAGTALTAAVVAAVNVSYRLLVALVTAGVAALIGFAGAFLLTAFDGCVGPLNTMASSCHWRPRKAWLITEDLIPQLLGSGVFAAVVAALLVIVVANLVRGLSRRGRQPPSRVRRTANRRNNLAIRRVCVAVICAAALGLVATNQVNAQRPSSNQPSLAGQLVANHRATPPSSKVRKIQLVDWYKYGGKDLFDSFVQTLGGIGQNIDDPDFDMTSKAGRGSSIVLLRSLCVDMEQWTKKADVYFLMPDPQAQSAWSKILAQTKKGSVDCQNALEQRNVTLLATSADELNTAGELADSLLGWFFSQIVGLR